MEQETKFAKSAAAKLKDVEYEDVETNAGLSYVILDFLTVFNFLSTILKCKVCNGDIKFTRGNERGLGFSLIVTCKCSNSHRVSSSPLVNTSYEINRRIMFAMRLLGLGFRAVNIFCCVMELSKGFTRTAYSSFMTNLDTATKAVFEQVQQKAFEEEKLKNVEHGNGADLLSVSRDSAWENRGFSSLFGVATLTGKYSCKVLDLVVKSFFCQACSDWLPKRRTPEYYAWKATHDEECTVNFDNGGGGKTFNAIEQMFKRSMDLANVKYENSDDDDLKRCIGVNEQNDNESLKACIWHFAPKHLHCGVKTVEIAAHMAASIYNEGYSAVMKMMNVLGIGVGLYTKILADENDNTRNEQADSSLKQIAKEQRIAKQRLLMKQNELYEEEEGILYGTD